MLQLGIDDAGRGPVMGPMVLAGCLLTKDAEAQLKKLGVTDSKKLTQKRREVLEEKIKELAETFEIVIVYPKEIDGQQENGIKLNEVEALACASIINKINKGFTKTKVIVDCPSTSIAKWSDFLKRHVENLSNLEVSCEHKADANSIAVGAASILAKCVREREMQKLKQKYGPEVGSGYCSDPLTTKFLQKYAKKYQEDGIFRKTWITWQRAVQNLSQRTL